jgi:hypothetical protein
MGVIAERLCAACGKDHTLFLNSSPETLAPTAQLRYRCPSTGFVVPLPRSISWQSSSGDRPANAVPIEVLAG